MNNQGLSREEMEDMGMGHITDIEPDGFMLYEDKGTPEEPAPKEDQEQLYQIDQEHMTDAVLGWVNIEREVLLRRINLYELEWKRIYRGQSRPLSNWYIEVATVDNRVIKRITNGFASQPYFIQSLEEWEIKYTFDERLKREERLQSNEYHSAFLDVRDSKTILIPSVKRQMELHKLTYAIHEVTHAGTRY